MQSNSKRGKEIVTRHMDKLAAEGARFWNHYNSTDWHFKGQDD